MAEVVTLADEIRSALALLHYHGYYRAANRLEYLSADILHPKPKPSGKPRATEVKIVGGSGRKWRTKVVLPEDE